MAPEVPFASNFITQKLLVPSNVLPGTTIKFVGHVIVFVVLVVFVEGVLCALEIRTSVSPLQESNMKRMIEHRKGTIDNDNGLIF